MSIMSAIGGLIRQITRVEGDVERLKRLEVYAPGSYGKASLKTIAAGAISVAKPHVVVLPETGTTDNLDTITNFADGKFIVISTADVGDTITVRDESISGGNIALRGVTSRVLSDPEDSLLLIYKESVGFWIQAGGTPGGGSPGAHATTHQHGGTDEVATATPAANAIPKAEGSGKLANGWLDATLESLAALGTAADRIAYTTGVDTWAETPLTSFARTILDDASQAAVQATLALTPGTDVQAQDAELQAIAGLTSAADKLPYFTGLGTAALADLSAYARTLIDDADDTTARATLGLGTIAVESEANYVLVAGTRPLTGEWDIGEDMAIKAERLEARDAEGLRIEDSSGNLGVFVQDGGNVGIGGTPTHKFSVVNDGLGVTASAVAYGAAVEASWVVRSIQGSEASPTRTLAGHPLGAFYFQGYDTAPSNGAKIYAIAAADWGTAGSGTDDPTDIRIATVPDGSNVITDRMAITSDGKVGIGTMAPSEVLEVEKNQNAVTAVRVENTDTTNTSSRATFDAVSGTVLIRTIAITGYGALIGTGSNDNMEFMTNGNSRLFFLNSGEASFGEAAVANRAQLNIRQILTAGNALRVIRNLAAASTDSPVVDIIEDHASDDQIALRVQNDGTGKIVSFLDGATEVFNIADGGVLNTFGGAIFSGSAGEFAAKIFAFGGFTRFTNSGKGDILYETTAVAAIAIQLQMTRPTSTTIVRGFWATVNMGGRIAAVVHGGTCRFFVQGRNAATIQYINGPANLNITVTTVTQTSTDLTLKFAITGAAGTWTEFSASIVADSPVHSSWTITGSQVA